MPADETKSTGGAGLWGWPFTLVYLLYLSHLAYFSFSNLPKGSVLHMKPS